MGFTGTPSLGTVLPDQGSGVDAARGVCTQLGGQVQKEESEKFLFKSEKRTEDPRAPPVPTVSSKPEVKDQGKVPKSRPHTEGQVAGGVVLVAGMGRWDVKRRMG